MSRRALLCAAALACEAPSPSPAGPVAVAAPAPVRTDVSAEPVAVAPAPVRTDVSAEPVAVAPTPVLTHVPGDPAAIRAWLQAFTYRGWTPMTDIRATGEHGGERLFFNTTLAASMRAGAQVHPIGSAAVRELYSGDLVTLKGFALMHKTGPSGDLGEGWYWYEIFGTTAAAEPTVAEPAARGCVGCHSHAVDFVHSPDTPREDPQPLL